MSVSNIGSGASNAAKPAGNPATQEKQSPTARGSAPGTGPESPAPSARPATGTGSDDTVHLSSAAVDLLALEAHISQLPDTDRARIGEIRNQIAKGDYRIDAARLAEQILGFESGLK